MTQLTEKELIRKSIFETRVLFFALPFILMAIPVFFYFKYISTYGINVLWWDEWELVPLLDKFNSGSLGFSDLYAQHNEHRIFFPNIVFLFLGNFTSLNSISNMYLSALLLLFTLMIIFTAWIRYSGFNELSLWWFIPVPYLLFSFAQFENTLWGFQLTFYMVIFFSVLSFALLETGRIISAMISALIASFSSIQGLIVWPIGILYFLISWKYNKKGNPRNNAITWIISGVGVWCFYFLDYQKPVDHPSIFFPILNPLESGTYFFYIIGAPVGAQAVSRFWAFFLGALIFILYCVLIKRIISLKNIPIFYLPLALIFFSLLFDIVTTFGRAGFGAWQAFASRYTSFNIVGLIGLYLSLCVILTSTKTGFKRDKFIMLLVVVIILIKLIISIPAGLLMGENTKIRRTEAKILLLNIEYASDQAIKKYLYSDAASLRNRATILQKLKNVR